MTTLDYLVSRNVNVYIDEHHAELAQLGGHLFDVFGYDKDKQNINTQVRNLQQVVCSAVCFADIEDFVKNQMGKKNGHDWQAIGPEVLDKLQELRSDASSMADDPAEQMAVRLRLARGWVRAVVGEYLYRVALDQTGQER